jgi:hypothetical protein
MSYEEEDALSSVEVCQHVRGSAGYSVPRKRGVWGMQGASTLHTYIHTCVHTYIHTYIHTYVHTYIHTTYIRMCICAYIHTYNIHTYVHTYIHTYISIEFSIYKPISK